MNPFLLNFNKLYDKMKGKIEKFLLGKPYGGIQLLMNNISA